MIDFLGSISRSIYDDFNYQDRQDRQHRPKNSQPQRQNSLDVYNFNITEWYGQGIYLVVKVKYLNAKHYEGNKVLVYEGVKIEELKKLIALDPHFSENKSKPTPIARFEPTDQGWVNAMKFCSMLHSERLELDY